MCALFTARTWRAVGACGGANPAAGGRARCTADAGVFQSYRRVFPVFAVLAGRRVEHVLAGAAGAAQVTGGGAELPFRALRALGGFRDFRDLAWFAQGALPVRKRGHGSVAVAANRARLAGGAV